MIPSPPTGDPSARLARPAGSGGSVIRQGDPDATYTTEGEANVPSSIDLAEELGCTGRGPVTHGPESNRLGREDWQHRENTYFRLPMSDPSAFNQPTFEIG